MCAIGLYDRLPIPETKLQYQAIHPFGRIYLSGAMAYGYNPRIIPESNSKAVIKDDQQLFELACLPGIKIVEVPNASYVNYLSAMTMATALTKYIPHKDGGNSAILATGGTWDGPRQLVGTPSYSESLIGAKLPTDKGLIFTCLDEYGYPSELWDSLIRTVGDRDTFLNARLNPISYGDIHKLFLFGAGFSERDFRFPPIGFNGKGAEEARVWRNTLATEIYPAVTANHGIGSYPFHDAFNDFADFETLTGYMGIAGSTKLQNGNDTTPPGWPQMSPMFRNIAASFQISEPELVYRKANRLKEEYAGSVPSQLSYYVPRETWQTFIENLDTEIAVAREVTGRMPTNVITQGLSDLIDGAGQGRSADLHVFSITGGHKAPAFLNCVSSPADERNPGSALNFYGRVIVFVERKSTHFARDYSPWFWQYQPDESTAKMIETMCNGTAIADAFWTEREANPGREKWTD